MARMTAIWTMLLLAGCAGVMAQATKPAVLKDDSTVDGVLDALDVRGKTLADFSAKLEMAETDTSTGDEKVWSGQIRYRKSPDDRDKIRVNFDEKKVDNKVVKGERVEYMLSDGVLADRDYKKKTQVRRQVLKPGQKMNLFKLGEGPFPLPLGQDKADVKREFNVTKIDRAKNDPAGSIHLKLEPRKGTDLARKFKAIDVFVDPATNMPTRIDATNSNETEMKSTRLTDIKLNAGLKADDFKLDEIKGWNEIDEEFKG
jgi:outer membrane lipoprotein-sorting protein